MDILHALGVPVVRYIRILVDFNIFVYKTILSFKRNLKHGKHIILRVTSFQVLFTAVDAIPLVILLSVFLFSAIIMQVDMFVPQVGAGIFLGKIFTILVVRELAPLIISFILIARSGTAIAAELSSMVVNQEIYSLKVLGLDPLYFIVAPRVIGMTISLLCLSFIFTVVTIVGGMLLSNYYLYVPTAQYMDGVFSSITPLDIGINIFKSILFGFIISFICCFYGISTRYASTEIPQMTTKAVISSFFWCFIISAFITVLYY